MDYQKHYTLLIERARTRFIEGYKEEHHVVPKCLGGSDDKSNLVYLTPEEHYVAHQLLVKMHPTNYKLVHAAVMMNATGDTKRKNKCYGWLKRKASEIAKQRVGVKNGSYGTRWVNDGTKSFKIKKDQPLEDGWKEGRSLKIALCLTCGCEIKSTSSYCLSCRHDIRLSAAKKIQKYPDEKIIELIKMGLKGHAIFQKLQMQSSKNNYIRLRRLMEQCIKPD